VKTAFFHVLPLGFLLVAAALFSWQARADNTDVRFPHGFADGIHYGTVERGGITEELYTDRAAIEAAKRGESFPDGTVITLVDHRDGGIFRYVVMEKRAGWGEDYPPEIRNGDWKYREFGPDRSPNMEEDGTRCMSCHKPQASQDFVFTVDLMRDTDLDAAGAN